MAAECERRTFSRCVTLFIIIVSTMIVLSVDKAAALVSDNGYYIYIQYSKVIIIIIVIC